MEQVAKGYSSTVFSSPAQYRASLRDLDFWWPHVNVVLRRHGIDAGHAVMASGSSYPTILCDHKVVKLYGYSGRWQAAFETELASYRTLAADPAIPAPRLLASGELTPGWRYLVTTKLPGHPWNDDEMTASQRLSAASDLGRHIARLHRLHPEDGVERYQHSPNLTAALDGSALPRRLAAQAANYVAHTRLDDTVFSHGDLFEGNILITGKRIAGLIDWGDAMVIDRHNELAKIHLSVFGGDKRLLEAFLHGAAWPDSPDFPRRAMAAALIRQATGIAQHGTGFDNFHLVDKLIDGRTVNDLHELACLLFEV